MKTHCNGWTIVIAAALLIVSSRIGQAGYSQTNLVSDGAVPANVTDPYLVNPWGLVFNPAGFSWVANNGTGQSTLYDGNGVKQSLVVNLPTPSSSTGAAATGIRRREEEGARHGATV